MPEDDKQGVIREETDEQFQLTGVEAEDRGDAAATMEPYDPELIRVDPKSFSLRQVLDMIDDGDLELAPDFQRLRVWSQTQKSRLIESVLLRIPLPAFYFSSDKAGKLQVVDGLQRLSTIHDFVRGGKNRSAYFPLDRLEYLEDHVGGLTIGEFKDSVWLRRINQTQILANVIDPQTPYRVKFDIFRRINTGGTPLNGQEIRHCLSEARSRGFLLGLVNHPAFSTATDYALINNVRMVDREVVLRFCAFRGYPGLPLYRQYPTMDEFLNAAAQWLDAATDEQLSNLQNDFVRAMENAFTIFGNNAFRKVQSYTDRRAPFNRALFEVWSVTLADRTSDFAAQNAAIIRKLAYNQMDFEIEFSSAISTSTGNPRQVEIRFDTVDRLLKSIP